MRVPTFVAVFTLLASITTPAQPPAGRKVGLADGLQAGYAGLKRDLIASAETMPDAGYALKPGTMPEVRTFAQVIAHVAAGQFGACASAKGVPNPAANRKLEEELKTKADIVKALAESFALCDDFVNGTTEENALQFVRQGPNEITRATAVQFLIAHDSEMYGIATVYLRLAGHVPPSTARQMKRQ
jgi:uncharacterized damage-inducible protein DinB